MKDAEDEITALQKTVNTANAVKHSLPNPVDLNAEQYQVLLTLGEGGMGVVYKALDIALNRIVAIKVLRKEATQNQTESLRFQQEAKAVANLSHANIIQLYGLSATATGAPFFIMEYVEGHPLSDELQNGEQLPIQRLVSVFAQTCDALAHAHEHGVIHRDIKPSNLMLTTDANTGSEVVKLVDFGIAKLHSEDGQTLQQLTQTGELFGSPFYMSPEQCSGQRVDNRTDIYSLGCVLYEMLCGSRPFQGATAFETFNLHLSAEPEPIWKRRNDLTAAEGLDRVIMKMLAKAPENRYATASEAKEALLQAVSKTAEPPGGRLFHRAAGYLSRGSARKKVALFAATSLAIVTACGILVIWCATSIIAGVPPNKVTPDLLYTPWNNYDLQGQEAFDIGGYPQAEDLYQKALMKARLERSSAHELISLHELCTLYLATENDHAYKKTEPVYRSLFTTLKKENADDFKHVREMLESIKNRSDLDEFLSVFANFSSAWMGSRTSEAEVREQAEFATNVVKKIQSLPFAGEDDLLIPYALIQYIKVTKYNEKLDFNVLKRAFGDPKVRKDIGFITLLGHLVNDRDSNGDLTKSFQDLVQHAMKDGTPEQKVRARALWIEHLKKVNDPLECLRSAKENLSAAQRLDPRVYASLWIALLQLGELHEARGNAVEAIPLLIRGKAIADFEDLDRHGQARRFLALAYIDTEDPRAEKMLQAIAESQPKSGPQQVLRAMTLNDLGYLYCRQHRWELAEQTLTEAIVIFEHSGALPAPSISPYAKAMDNLTKVYRSTGRAEQAKIWQAKLEKFLSLNRNLRTIQSPPKPNKGS